MERIHLINMDIVLEDDKTMYEAGDCITGKLQISHNGVLSLSNVKLGITCMAEVKWVETPGTRYHRDGHVYHDIQKYLDFIYVLPEEFIGQSFEKGAHEIPFKFHLPDSGIPSSFVSVHGCVTYYIEAIIEEPVINEIHRTGKEIVVEAPFRQNLLLSVGGSVEKDLGIFCLGSGCVQLYATISKKGHIPGELIEVFCTVENRSSVSVTPRATVYQTQIFMSGERHKTIETTLIEPTIGETVEKNSSNTETLLVLIPEDMSLSIKSRIITVKYFIHITLDIPHAIDLHINLPIIITNKHTMDAIEVG